MKHSITDLYQVEFNDIFNKKQSGVRLVTVISAFLEGQIFTLASLFLEKRNVVHKPKQYQEYRQSLNVLDVNNVLSPKQLTNIEKFRKERNKSIHGIFKGMTRDEWNKQNKLVIELGKPIVKELDIELRKVL